MPKLLRKIGRIFAMKLSENLQYRGDLFLWTIADMLVPTIALTIWYTVAKSQQSPVAAQEILAYYLAVIAVRYLTGAWSGYLLATEILRGELVRHLVRPFSIFWVHIAENVSAKLIRLWLPLLLLVPAWWYALPLLPTSLREPGNMLLFAVSVFLAFVLLFTVDLTLGSLAFWLEDALQLREYEALLYEIASGTLIPLAFLPPVIASAVSFLPWRFMLSAPVEILLSQLTITQSWQIIAAQLGWIATALTLLSLIWHKGLQRYAVPGY